MDVEALRPDLRAVFAATRLRTDEETDFILVSLPPDSYYELLTTVASLRDTRFQATVRAPNEVTLIAPRDLWERISMGFPSATVDTPWKLITLDITLGLDVYGYIEQVARLCAGLEASLIIASGYSTDHLLINAEHYPAVRDALQSFIDRCRSAAGR
ncbi:MAG TPA: hypothetical protein VKY74_13440 [Chloroflexia bacterium]|nr:hypothetical protein [Chloroflexia bacterium]